LAGVITGYTTSAHLCGVACKATSNSMLVSCPQKDVV